MGSLISSSKLTVLSTAIVGMMLIFLPINASYAKAGCCSGHGGVASCDTKTGYQICKDGTPAPTCTCKKATKKTTKKTTTTPTVTTTAPAATTVTTPTKTTKTNKTTKTTGTSHRGCCSKHGGVAGCDSKTGHELCKDGTPSPSCPC